MSQENVERLGEGFERFLTGQSDFGTELRGRSTGIEVPFGKYAQLYTFTNGLIVHWKGYCSQAEALEAAGLQD